MPIHCGRCGAELPGEVLTSRAMNICPSCNSGVMVRVFAGILNRHAAVQAGDVNTAEPEASCFFHPTKTAAAACSRCGRFVCPLCRTEHHGEDWCPECLTSGARKKKIAALENHRTLYDSIALGLATWPAATVWLSLLGAPAALFVAIRYWKAPSSIVRRTKIRHVAALLLAVLQIAAWAWGITYFVMVAARTKS